MNPKTSKASLSLTGGTLAILGATAASSSGAIHYSSVNDGAGLLATSTGSQTIYLNVLTGTHSLTNPGAANYQLQITPIAGTTSGGTVYQSKFQVGHPNAQTNGTGAIAEKIDSGEIIDASLTYTTTNYNTFNDGASTGWSLGDTGYYGYRFQNGGTTNYGWAQFQFTGTPTYAEIRLLAYGYEDSGSGIAAGAIPEPSVPVLLTGCAAAFAARRRRHASVA